MLANDLHLCLECCSSGGVFSRILLVETGHLVSLYISSFIFYFIYNFIISFSFYSNFNIFLKKHRRVSKSPVESGVGLFVTKIHDSPLYFVSPFQKLPSFFYDSFICLSGLYMYFMIGVNSIFIECNMV